jgi:hypothetical protein
MSGVDRMTTAPITLAWRFSSRSLQAFDLLKYVIGIVLFLPVLCLAHDQRRALVLRLAWASKRPRHIALSGLRLLN